MHLDDAKNQRRVVKEFLKLSIRELLHEQGDFNLAVEEFDSCLNHWNCNHERETASSDVLVSNEDELFLKEVSILNVISMSLFQI